jgi:hypothetical protein
MYVLDSTFTYFMIFEPVSVMKMTHSFFQIDAV